MYACGQSPRQQDDSTSTTAEADRTVDGDLAGSYTYEKNGDTVALHLTIHDDKAMGHLTYALKEKDLNTGSFEGRVTDGILRADYTYLSEGQSSIRQVAFKVDGKTAVEGYADMEEKNGKFVFKDSTKLDFGEGLVLTKK